MAIGICDGEKVGIFVDTYVGECVGKILGIRVGFLIGFLIGLSIITGIMVGFKNILNEEIVGINVGKNEGTRGGLPQ